MRNLTVMCYNKNMHIYLLKDPNNSDVKYVGKSKNVFKRFGSHLVFADKETFPVYIWMNGLLQNNQLPILEIVESNLTEKEANIREKYWIDYYRSRYEITNIIPDYSNRKKVYSLDSMRPRWTILDVSGESISKVQDFAKKHQYSTAGAISEIFRRAFNGTN